MREFRRKRKIQSVIYSIPMAVILFILIIVLAKATWNSYKTYSSSRASSNNSFLELKNLKDREAYLKDQIKFLNTEEGIEAEIRDKYKAVKEGEEITVIIENEDSTSSVPSGKK
jgi:cell division protein FtsB